MTWEKWKTSTTSPDQWGERNNCHLYFADARSEKRGGGGETSFVVVAGEGKKKKE